MMEATGFPFRAPDGAAQDCLATLRGYGMNAIRLRAFINPSSHPHHGHCSTAETLAMGLRAARMGMEAMVDFHYGDSWRDPNYQGKPDAWKDLPFEELVQAVYDYTETSMREFLRNGFAPKWVQIGNETNPGMLTPDGSTSRFDQLARLYNAGNDAVKAVSPDSITMIHLAEGNKTGFLLDYFENLEKHGCAFDAIGLSYYPWWLKVSNESIIGDLAVSLKKLPERFDKDVYIVETGGEDDKERETFDLLESVLRVCADAPRCRGLFYWEPEGARAWSNYNLSAWRADGVPSSALDAFALADIHPHRQVS
jgi:arabinogalactan endo-1,4-beta-galactosidase